jgi:hypothetical protein
MPRIDPTLLADRVPLRFRIPAEFSADITLHVDETSDMETWRRIASREGPDEWFFQFPNILFRDAPSGGYRGVGVTATNTFFQRIPGLY